jgi:sterol desaturase/sphingolipid hydroxylase (fatty acid hydroxylase superfamily)
MSKEQIIRLVFFFGVLAVVAAWEVIAPRRPLTDNKIRRWFTNLSLIVVDTAVTRLILPVLPVGMAMMAQDRGWGFLNISPLPFQVKAVLAVLVLDFVIYLQHVLFHFLPTLWRLHRMHHTDLDIDVTTGIRFHPIEILVSTGIKLGAVTLLGAPAISVIFFEVALNATSQFNHGNIRISIPLDRWLRFVIVTPDMHRVHHSVIPRETNSNFGFNLPWWDRLCGTYRAQPESGHTGMTIGLKEYREPQMLTLPRLLIQPFRTKEGQPESSSRDLKG